MISQVFPALMAAMFLTVTPVWSQSPSRGISGKSAPAWTVSKWHQLPVGKKNLDVSDFRGKVVYLYFFQSWCPGCHSSGFPTLKELSTAYANDSDVAFVAIQTTFEGHRVNTADKLAKMAERYDLSIPFGHSEGAAGHGRSASPQIMWEYRTGGTPWTVLIDKQGRVRFNDFHLSVSEASEYLETLKREKVANR